MTLRAVDQVQHVHQRPKECILASVAMVFGLDYASLSNSYAYQYGRTWGMDCSHPRWLAYLHDLGVAADMHFITTNLWMPLVPVPETDTWFMTVGSCCRDCAHATVLHHNIVYDSLLHRPYIYSAWREIAETVIAPDVAPYKLIHPGSLQRETQQVEATLTYKGHTIDFDSFDNSQQGR